jgi:hypothetical protein
LERRSPLWRVCGGGIGVARCGGVQSWSVDIGVVVCTCTITSHSKIMQWFKSPACCGLRQSTLLRSMLLWSGCSPVCLSWVTGALWCLYVWCDVLSRFNLSGYAEAKVRISIGKEMNTGVGSWVWESVCNIDTLATATLHPSPSSKNNIQPLYDTRQPSQTCLSSGQNLRVISIRDPKGTDNLCRHHSIS